MIITRTPFRISLFGGGTDYPSWYRQHGGAVIGTTINKYCYISLRELPPFFDHRHRLVWSKVELVNRNDEIEHPAIKAVFEERGVDRGLELHHDGDLPARSGLGSSSSFTVGLLHALSAFEGRMTSPEWLAREAIRLEQEVMSEHVGSQDQVWAAYGGTNLIEFRTDDSFSVSPVLLSAERRELLQSHLMLFFTGFSRIASSVAAAVIANLDRRREQVSALGDMAQEALSILQGSGESLSDIGAMLHESWRIKLELSTEVSSPSIDSIYEQARGAGALGGKLLGAGGGGFMLLFAPPEAHPAVRAALTDLIEVRFEMGSGGSRVVLYEPDGLENR